MNPQPEFFDASSRQVPWLVSAALATTLLLAGSATTAAPNPAASAPRTGETVFNEDCRDCHGRAKAHTPPPELLRYMPASLIYKSLTTGMMRKEATDLSDAEKHAVAEFLGTRAMAGEAAIAPPACTGRAQEFDYDEPPVFQFAGLDAGNRHNVAVAVSGITPANVGNLHVKYAIGFPDSTRVRSQPAIAGGALYVGSQSGVVYAFDRASGCVRWRFDAAAEVRTAITVTPWQKGDSKARPLAYFGDLVGNLYAVDAVTGKLAWKDVPDRHPSATLTVAPLLSGNRLYQAVASLEEAAAQSETYACCKFRGSVVAYDAASGKRLWQTFTTDPPVKAGKTSKGVDRFGPSGVAIWSLPALDARRGQLIVTTGDNYSQPTTSLSDAIVAIDLESGRVRWSYQALERDAWNVACVQDPKGPNCPEDDGPDYDFGAGPVVTTASDGRDIVLAGQKSGWVYAVNPEDGAFLWKTRVGRGGILAGVYFGMATDRDTVFVPVSDSGDGRKYDMAPQPGLYALDIRTGAFKWRTPNADNACGQTPFCEPGLAATISTTSGLVFAGSLDGWLRVYDGETGNVVWRFDTTQRFKTVGGGYARGGSMQSATAPLLYDGTVILLSGYDFTGKMPGNVLLVLDTH